MPVSAQSMIAVVPAAPTYIFWRKTVLKSKFKPTAAEKFDLYSIGNDIFTTVTHDMR